MYQFKSFFVVCFRQHIVADNVILRYAAQSQQNGAYNTDFERLNGIIVPLTPGTDASYTWLPSRTYTYNVVFGEGAGWDGNGDPAIAPVGITASVAGFSSQDVWVPAN